MTEVQIAVEGKVDRAVAERLVRWVRGSPGRVYGGRGKGFLRKHLSAWNAAAEQGVWFVLVDLNSDEECAPLLVRSWLPVRAPQLCFRVAVREVEAWLLADRESIASFLGVPKALVPEQPERVADPKGAVVDLARRSRNRYVRQELVPDPRSGRREGPGYASQLAAFARDQWRPDVAAGRAPSLRGALACLGKLMETAHPPSAGNAGRSCG